MSPERPEGEGMAVPGSAGLSRPGLRGREAELERLESANEGLEADVARLDTDQGIADAVRAELGAVHADEKVYRIVMDPQLLTLLPEGWLYPTLTALISVRAGIVPPLIIQPSVVETSVVVPPGVVEPGVVQPSVVQPSVVEPGVVPAGG